MLEQKYIKDKKTIINIMENYLLKQRTLKYLSRYNNGTDFLTKYYMNKQHEKRLQLTCDYIHALNYRSDNNDHPLLIIIVLSLYGFVFILIICLFFIKFYNIILNMHKK
jgi:hypothetical protein